jgi:hypothetical protein
MFFSFKSWTVVELSFGSFILFLILWFFLFKRDRYIIKRKKELKEWAESKELGFAERIDDSDLERYSGFTRLSEGYGKSAANVIFGKWNRIDLIAFDYDYAMGDERSARWHSISAVIIDAKADLHPVVVQPSGLWDGWAVSYGFTGIDFPDDKEFADNFWVSSPEIEWANKIVTPVMKSRDR